MPASFSAGAILHATFSKREKRTKNATAKTSLSIARLSQGSEVRIPLPGPLIHLDGQRNHLYERLRLFSWKKIWTRGGGVLKN